MRQLDFAPLDLTLPDLTVPDDLVVAAPVPADRYDGAEESRSVWVTVDRRAHLADVSISTTWRQRLAPERFADALYTAYTDAVGRALAGELAAGRAPVRQQPSAAMEPLQEHNSGLDVWLAGVRVRLSGIEAQLRSAADKTDTANVRETEVRGPNGYVTLTVRGGTVAGISGNAAGLKSANPNAIRQDVLDAFQNVGR